METIAELRKRTEEVVDGKLATTLANVRFVMRQAADEGHWYVRICTDQWPDGVTIRVAHQLRTEGFTVIATSEGGMWDRKSQNYLAISW